MVTDCWFHEGKLLLSRVESETRYDWVDWKTLHLTQKVSCKRWRSSSPVLFICILFFKLLRSTAYLLRFNNPSVKEYEVVSPVELHSGPVTYTDVSISIRRRSLTFLDLFSFTTMILCPPILFFQTSLRPPDGPQPHCGPYSLNLQTRNPVPVTSTDLLRRVPSTFMSCFPIS